MKKVIIFFAVTILIYSCNKYNIKPCETINKEGVTLSDDWNDCATIGTLFSYMIKSENFDPDNLPFSDVQGDTIKVKGWIYNNPDGFGFYIYLTDDSLYALSETMMPMPTKNRVILFNPSMQELLKDVDKKKKCYVTGRLKIVTHPMGVFTEDDNESYCYVYSPEIIPFEIKSER